MHSYLYLISAEECLITVNGKFLGSITKVPFEVVTEAQSVLYITVNPLSAHMPFSFRLELDNGQIKYPKEHLRAIKLPANRYELRLNLQPIRQFRAPQILAQSKIKTQDKPQKKYYISIVKDAYTKLYIDNGITPYSHIMPDGLENVIIKPAILGDSLVTAVTAKLPEDAAGRKKTYLLMVTADKDQNYKIMIEQCADKIEQAGNKISVAALCDDIAARAKVTVYSASNFMVLETYYVYSLGEPQKTTERELMPVAVFQAVKCEDFAEAYSYLTQDLASVLPPEKLAGFFEEFCQIIPNNYFSDISDSFILVRPDDTAALYRASFVGNLIDNFSEIEL